MSYIRPLEVIYACKLLRSELPIPTSKFDQDQQINSEA